MTEQERQERIDEFLGRNPEILMWKSKSSLTKKRKFKCNKCKWRWSEFPIRQARRKGCPVCVGSKDKKYVQYRMDMHLEENKMEMLTPLGSPRDNVLVRCLKCKREWETYPMKMYTEYMQGCAHCKIKEKKKKQERKLKSYIKKNGTITMISKFESTNEPVKLKCVLCNRVWSDRPSDITGGRAGCINCISSKGEDEVKRILKKYNIAYVSQWTDHNCYYKNKLRFDFKITELGYESVIEYHGKQHYEYVEFFHRPREIFEESKKRDRIKEQYCIKNDISYLEIKYDDLNIEKTVLNFLKIKNRQKKKISN